MIGSLRGKLVAKTPPFLLLDVNGVGYELEAPMSTFYDLPDIGEEVALCTHLTVRDDAHVLYAFANEEGRTLFRSLLKVSGVGAKMALAILSGMTPREFAKCVSLNDVPTLTRLPGVGKKTAERLIIEMRDRLDRIGMGVSDGAYASTPAPSDLQQGEAIEALIALGYKPNDAGRMVRAVEGEGLSSEEMIRAALQAAAKK